MQTKSRPILVQQSLRSCNPPDRSNPVEEFVDCAKFATVIDRRYQKELRICSRITQRLIECAPNFSDGRDLDVIRLITDAIQSMDSVSLLDGMRQGIPSFSRLAVAVDS